MTFVLSSHPLAEDYRGQLEARLGHEPLYLTVAGLRRLPLNALLKTLRSLRGRRCLLPVQNTGGQALLPLLTTLAVAASPRSVTVVDPELRFEALERGRRYGAPARLAWASLLVSAGIRRARREVAQLAMEPRMDASVGNGTQCLYINGNLWFGLAVGGSVGHVAGVINGLVSAGYRVDLISAAEPTLVHEDVRFRQLDPGVTGLPVEGNYYRLNQSIPKQARSLLDGSEHAFLYQRMSVANYAGVLVSRERGIPLVLEYNGSEVWTARHWGRPLRYEHLAQQAEDVCLRHAHLIVTVSDVLRDELVSRGVERERIVVYPNGVDPAIFDPDRYGESEIRALRLGLGIPQDAIVGTFIGTFGHWHGVEVLAHAIRRMIDEEEQWLREHRVRFLLIGDGLKRPDVERALAGVGRDEFVITPGAVPQAIAPLYLAASDILFSPHVPNPDGSPFFGSPTKLFEYMAMGRAIVASRLNQIGEVLQPSLTADALPTEGPRDDDAQLAVLAEPADIDGVVRATRFLTEQVLWRTRLGANVRAEAQARYTWKHHVAAILAAIDTRIGPDSNHDRA